MNRSNSAFAVALAVFFTPCFWLSSRSSVRGQEKPDKTELVKKELEALQGTWKFIVHEEGGKEIPLAKRKFVIEKDKLTYFVNDEVNAEGTFEVDPTTSPKLMDLKLTSGQVDLKIYVLAGNYMIACGHRDGKTRPSEFASGTDKGGEYLLVLQRQKQ